MNEQTRQARGQLLIVNADAAARTALKRQFRRAYDVYAAPDIQAGCALLLKTPIQVVLSDRRMPELTGAGTLGKRATAYPEAVRLVLIGDGDAETLIAAINDGNVFRYVRKPADAAELDEAVRAAFEGYDLLAQKCRVLQQLQDANAQLEQHVSEHTAALEDANARLQTLIAQQNAFLGMAAHDLRTPITVIQGFTDLLVHPRSQPEDTREFVSIIRETLDQMLSLLDDILDITAIESGKLTLRPREVDLEQFVGRVVKLNRYIGAQKQIALVAEVEPNLPPMTFDPDRIEQVLNNLIGNAFKFSHGDSTVTVRVRKVDNAVEFSVVDEGQGIPSDEIDKVFGEFQRVSTQPTAAEHSTGLGLSICKRIVGLHEGQIGVESEIGAGSRFYFTLPLRDKKIPAPEASMV